MNPERSRLLTSLLRVERALSPAFPEERITEIRELLSQVRALPESFHLPISPPSLPPLRHFRPRARKLAADPAPILGRALPTPPKARPLLDRLRGKKNHLRLVPQPLVAREVSKETPPDPIGERMREAEGARALLLEIVRRAAYDWVLYRSSTRLDQKILAEDAYIWLFVEDEDHPNWNVREQEEKELTAFVTICNELDLDVEKVRAHIRRLTPNKVMSSGRPPENSRASDHSPAIHIHASVPDASGGTDGSFDFDSLLNPGTHDYD